MEPFDLLCALGAGHRLAFRATHQEYIAACGGSGGREITGQHRQIFGMGVRRQTQRRSGEWLHDLDQRMSRVAYAEQTAHCQQARHARRQRLDRHEDRPALGEMRSGLFNVLRKRESERLQYFGGGDPIMIVRHAVDQHRHALPSQQQRQQRRQIRHLARAVVTRDHDRRIVSDRRRQMRERCFRRIEETGNLVDRLALDAHREHDCTEFQIGHAAIQHRCIKLKSVIARQAARTFFATSDFPDETGCGKRFGDREISHAQSLL